jgi:hypothetical protein
MYTLEEHSQVKQNGGCYQSTETTSLKTQRLQILVVEVGVLLTKVGSICGTKCKHIKL